MLIYSPGTSPGTFIHSSVETLCNDTSKIPIMESQNGEKKSDPDPVECPVQLPAETLVAMPLLQQCGMVFVGPGAKKEAQSKKYALEQSVKHVLMKQQIAHQQNQQKVAMYAQALSLMARVYIGSISFEVREEQIKQNFSVFGPIKTINMSWDTVTGHHKGFAFLEFEVPEAALLAQEAMNGKLVGGRNLKVLPVGRPANMPQAQPIIEMVMQEAKDYNRVYVSSVHPDLSEQDLRSVFEAFGEIVKCQLAKQPGKGHRGFGYLEFKTAQAVKEAIEGMNNFDLGGQHLQVGRCITPPEALTYVMPSAQSSLPSASAAAAAAVTAKIQAQDITGAGKSSPNSKKLGNNSPTSSYDNHASASPQQDSRLINGSPRAINSASSPTPTTNPGDVPAPAIVNPLPPPQLMAPPPVGVASVAPIQVAPPTLLQETKPKPPPPTKKDILSRIKIKTIEMNQKASFAPLPDLIAPKDKVEKTSEPFGDMLAIGGPEGSSSSRALALRDTSSKELAKTSKQEQKSSSGENVYRKKKKVKPPKAQGPKLSTPQALAAAAKVGMINDQMQAANAQNEEATLASQEHVEIRGNDARHLLMHKLMRTNRSSVICLKNMVTVDGIDNELEDEIRSECEKFGPVKDVCFVQEDEISQNVKVFVNYVDPSSAECAKTALDKRYFDGRTIAADFYDQILFDHGDFTG
uniref:RRM domain-containing protein n=1 Tax=Ditylenchus dipsaci TaxID=166011 RepID=A0A915CNV9_9BILA